MRQEGGDGQTLLDEGQVRAPRLAGGKVALPSDVAAEYRNLVLIPILPAR